LSFVDDDMMMMLACSLLIAWPTSGEYQRWVLMTTDGVVTL